MAIHAVLGGTGSTGSAVIRALLKDQRRNLQPGENASANKDEIRVLVRSKDKLLALLPQLEHAANVTIVEGSMSSQAALATALRDATFIYSCIATNYSEPGMTIALDSAAAIISALKSLRGSAANNYRRPTVLMLSSGALNPTFPKPPAIIGAALHYLYADLGKAEALYSESRTNDPGLLEAVFVQPPGIMPGTEPTGHALSTEADHGISIVSFADLGEGMVEIAERKSEFVWKGVTVKATGKVVADWKPNVKYLALGMLAYYFPRIWGVGRRWSWW